MATIRVTASQGADNVTTFDVIDSDDNPVDLDVLGAVNVVVEVCDGIYQCAGPQTIDTADSNVTWAGNVISAKLGQLQVETGMYKPKVSYFLSSGEEEVIVADGFKTQMLLKMVC